ncbi:MAG: hypothetical protein HY290_00985 [Planctomycetia bacterium]|nr:hypothetical protein [Planctomycetia bacterium]
MHRSVECVLVALVLTELFHQTGFAQDAQRKPPSPVGASTLMRPVVSLESESVRQELRLTTEQRDQISSILNRVKVARESLGLDGNLASLTPEIRKARRAEFGKIADQANIEVSAALTESQRERLRQLAIWILRGDALFTQDVVNELKLTDGQKTALADEFESLRKKMLDIQFPAKGTDEERRRKVHEQSTTMKKEFDERCVKILTDQQRAQFDKMRGDRFEVEMSEFPTIYGRGGARTR